MLSRRTEYHTLKEYYTPRIEKNYTYSIKTLKSTSRKGNDYSFGRNDYSTYGTGSYYNSNSFSSKKCSCRECDYGRLENCTCEKCLNEGKSKYTSLTVYNTKKTSSNNYESNELDQKCTCGEEEESHYGTSTYNYNITTNIGTNRPCRTCGRLVCKCGQRAHNSVIHEIKHKNIKRKCICGDAEICTCGARKNKKKVVNRNIEIIKSDINTATTSTVVSRKNKFKLDGSEKHRATSSLVSYNNRRNDRLTSLENYRRHTDDQCTCGLDHSRLNSANNYVKTIESKYITQVDNLNCTC